jgi:hypothetical protein
MKKATFILISTFACFTVGFCQIKNEQNLALDHIFILVENGTDYSKILQEKGLTLAEKWKTPHKGQGTTGAFFFFLNFYFEILMVDNLAEAQSNLQNFGHDYLKRSQWRANQSCAFALGFCQIPWDTLKIPFATQKYKTDWMGKEHLRMAKSNTDLKEPIIFVEPPSFANQIFEKIEDLESAAKYNTEAKNYRLNSLNIQKLSAVKLTIAKKQKQFSETLKQLGDMKNLQIVTGKRALLELTFDEGKQGKKIDLQKEMNFIIWY